MRSRWVWALLILPCLAGAADDRFAAVEVTSVQVAGPGPTSRGHGGGHRVYMLKGAGGNVGASIGPDGTFMIDADFKPLSERLLAALEAIGGDRPRLLLNTHVHSDHVGGNGFFGSSVIFSHENVRLRLLGEGIARPALPILTFTDRLRLHFNDDDIEIIHLPTGHTDGDSIVWFRKANVVHMGDQFWNGLFPRIDTDAGGSVDGYLANIDRVVGMIDVDTAVIPGHGELGDKQDLMAAADMIRATRQRVDQAVVDGELEALIAAGLGERWRPWGAWFITEETWIRTLAAAAAD